MCGRYGMAVAKRMKGTNVQLRKLDEKTFIFMKWIFTYLNKLFIKCHFLIIKSDWIRDFNFKMKSIKLFLTAKYL